LHEDYNFLNNSQTSTWSLEDGYEPEAPLDTYPFRSLAMGEREGLQINLIFDPAQFDSVCKDSYGFKVIGFK
jgi:acid-sensing ion channel, other